MPTLKRKYSHSKVYRPNGTRYSTGEGHFTRPYGDKYRYEHYALSAAISRAVFAFREEFGEDPDWECVVAEIVCDSTSAHATLLEIKDENND